MKNPCAAGGRLAGLSFLGQRRSPQGGGGAVFDQEYFRVDVAVGQSITVLAEIGR